MRRFVIAVFSVTFALAAETAQAECACGYPHHGKEPCQRCRHDYMPTQKLPERESIPAQPEGAYAAPPRTGAVAGETRAIGVEGLSIEFPALRIGFPSIRLPALTRYRTGPRMLVSEGVAPFIQDYREEASFERAAIQQQPESAPVTPELGPKQRSAEYDLLPPRPPACNRETCDGATGLGWLTPAESLHVGGGTDYDERLARLELMEARLQRQMELMARLVERLDQGTCPSASLRGEMTSGAAVSAAAALMPAPRRASSASERPFSEPACYRLPVPADEAQYRPMRPGTACEASTNGGGLDQRGAGHSAMRSPLRDSWPDYRLPQPHVQGNGSSDAANGGHAVVYFAESASPDR